MQTQLGGFEVYKKIEKKIEDPKTGRTERLHCEICLGNTKDRVSHFIHIRNLDKILDSKSLNPVKSPFTSGAVSFTKNSDFTFVSSNVKLTFKEKNVPKLTPMCYYDYNKLSGKEKKLIDHIESLSSVDFPKDEVMAEFGIQPSMYKHECEWYTKTKVPIRGNVEEVSMYIPLVIGENYFSDCKRAHPKYSSIGLSASMDTLKGEIKKVKKFADSIGAKFKVDSTFPYIRDYWNGTYIPLDEDNLKRLSEGKDPITTRSPPPVDPENECNLLM